MYLMATKTNGTTPANPYPHSITATVTEPFYEAVRKASRKAGLTMQTWARYTVMRAAGLNVARPQPELQGNFNLGTNLDPAAFAAVGSLCEQRSTEDEPYAKAQFLREALAAAAGYTLSDADKPQNTGEAAKLRAAVGKERNALVDTLWETRPDVAREIAASLGKKLSELGIYDPEEPVDPEEDEQEQEQEPAGATV